MPTLHDPTPHPSEPLRFPERDAGELLRTGADELRPYLAHGATVAARLGRALVAVVRNVLIWAVLGAIGGWAFASSQGGDPIWTAMFGVMVGGGVGLFFGAIAALRILVTTRRPPT